MKFERRSACKINLLLNVLGRRADGFHELETLIHPLPLWDRMEFIRQGDAIEIIADHPGVPSGPENLIYRAAQAFFERTAIHHVGVQITLTKRIPVAAGLGGGSGNAATTLQTLNDLFDRPLALAEMEQLAATVGSDVPLFLHSTPMVATGRGEILQPVTENLPALKGVWVLLVHPGFGVPTAWAYRELAAHPAALNGQPGAAGHLLELLRGNSLAEASPAFHNSLEAPVLKKYPILALYQEFLREAGAPVTLMTGSGSTTFALVQDEQAAVSLEATFRSRFGQSAWTLAVPLHPELVQLREVFALQPE